MWNLYKVPLPSFCWNLLVGTDGDLRPQHLAERIRWTKTESFAHFPFLIVIYISTHGHAWGVKNFISIIHAGGTWEISMLKLVQFSGGAQSAMFHAVWKVSPLLPSKRCAPHPRSTASGMPHTCGSLQVFQPPALFAPSLWLGFSVLINQKQCDIFRNHNRNSGSPCSGRYRKQTDALRRPATL